MNEEPKTRGKLVSDPELVAMASLLEILATLPHETAWRTLRWTLARFELAQAPKQEMTHDPR